MRSLGQMTKYGEEKVVWRGKGTKMRWDELFRDLETQWAHQQTQQLEADIADAYALERSRMQLADRLRASIGREVALHLRGGMSLKMIVENVGSDWLSGSSGAQRALIPSRAVLSVDGLLGRSQAELSETRQRQGVGAPLKALARGRAHVTVQGSEGPLGAGIITHVSADHLDMVLQPVGSVGFRGQRKLRTIPLEAINAVLNY